MKPPIERVPVWIVYSLGLKLLEPARALQEEVDARGAVY